MKTRKNAEQKKRLGRDRAGNKIWILGHEGVKKKLYKNCDIVRENGFFHYKDWENEDFVLRIIQYGLLFYTKNILPLETCKSYEEVYTMLKEAGYEN